MRVRNAQAANSYVRGFDVVLARDCVGAWSDDDMRRTLAAVEAFRRLRNECTDHRCVLSVWNDARGG